MKIFRLAKKIITLAVLAVVIYAPFGIANSRYNNYVEKLSQLENIDNPSIGELEEMFIEISDARSEAVKMRMFLPEEKRERLGGEKDFDIAEDITQAIAEIIPEGEFLDFIN